MIPRKKKKKRFSEPEEHIKLLLLSFAESTKIERIINNKGRSAFQ